MEPYIFLPSALKRDYVHSALRKHALLIYMADKEVTEMQARRRVTTAAERRERDPNSELHRAQLRRINEYLKAKPIIMQEVESHIKEVGRRDCLSLCEQLQTRLPRELLDLVYKHLFVQVDEPERIMTVWPSTKDSTAMLSTHERWYKHVNDPTFVDQLTRYEIAESWYTHSTFIVDGAWDFKTRLRDDPWGFDLIPRDRIRKLEISMEHEYRAKFKVLADQMGNLFYFASTVYIELRFSKGLILSLPAHETFEGLTILYPVLRRLLEAGHSISIAFGGDRRRKLHTSDMESKALIKEVRDRYYAPIRRALGRSYY